LYGPLNETSLVDILTVARWEEGEGGAWAASCRIVSAPTNKPHIVTTSGETDPAVNSPTLPIPVKRNTCSTGAHNADTAVGTDAMLNLAL
jgi:hypothetical protein